MRAVIAPAPEAICSELRDLNVYRLLERASAYRPGSRRDLVSLTKVTLRMLARRAPPSGGSSSPAWSTTPALGTTSNAA